MKDQTLALDRCPCCRWPLSAHLHHICVFKSGTIQHAITTGSWWNIYQTTHPYIWVQHHSEDLKGEKKKKKRSTVLVISFFVLRLMDQLIVTVRVLGHSSPASKHKHLSARAMERRSRAPHNCQLQSLSEPCVTPPRFWEALQIRMSRCARLFKRSYNLCSPNWFGFHIPLVF